MHLEKVYEELRHSEYPIFIWGAGSMSVEVENKKLLIDERSRCVLEKYIAVSTTNDIRYLLESDICVESMLGLEELNISATETYVDIGAWEGDTIDLFLKRTKGHYDYIYGVEPDPCTFARLKNKFIERPDISLFHCGLGVQEGELYLSTEDSQSTYLTQTEVNGSQKVSVTTMDNLFTDKSVSLVKIFVPFMSLDILKGGENVIKQSRPRLIIYASCDDKFLLYDIVQWIANLDMSYKLALRFDFPMPTRLILYAY